MVVRFRAGIPDLVTETVLVEVAHFEATVLTVKGLGTFPGVVLDLPRRNESEHRLQLESAAKRLPGGSRDLLGPGTAEKSRENGGK